MALGATRWTAAASVSLVTFLGRSSDTKTIRVREGELQVADEAVGEQALRIAGFNILECADLKEAIEAASKNPGASFGVLELRPIEE